MKKQSKILQGAFIALSFSATLFTIAGCNDSNEKTTEITKEQAKVKALAVDIHTAIVTDNVEALKQQIAAKSNLNEKDPMGGSTPLLSASLFGKTEMVKLLIDAGADLNVQNNEGSTALITAAFFCRPEIVKMLLDKGADKTIKNKYGQTAYESVAAPFATAKPAYDALGKMLEPMGLKLDYTYLEKTRPELASTLK